MSSDQWIGFLGVVVLVAVLLQPRWPRRDVDEHRSASLHDSPDPKD